MEEISSDQTALRLVQRGVWLECVLHLGCARLENIEQIAMTAFEVLQHVAQLLRCGIRIEPQHSIDDMVRPGLVGRIEVSRLSRRFERPDDDSG